MNMITQHRPPPNDQDAALARMARQVLAAHTDGNSPLALRIDSPDQTGTITLPASAVAMLMEMLAAMATGRGVTIIPEDTELSTAQAAEILHVSRPFLIKLLEDRQIPHRKVGKHRRIRLDDVMTYKSAIDQEREAVLDELAADAQAHDMGYGDQ